MSEIDKDLELADEWARSVSPWAQEGWRATCKRLANEVRRLREAAEEQRASATIRGANVETLQNKLADALADGQRLLSERNAMGVVVMRALNGHASADHPMAGVLSMVREAGRDAARYRWLRTYRPGLLLDMLSDAPKPDEQYATDLDAEIDASIGAELSAAEVDALLDASEVRHG